jgi:hypothetical protein
MGIFRRVSAWCSDSGKGQWVGSVELHAHSVVFEEVDDGLAEFFGLFEVHEVAGVGDYDAAGPGDAGLDCSGVRVDIRDVGVADQEQGWDVNFRQAWQGWLFWEFAFWVGEVLRAGGKDFGHALSGCVARRGG